MIYGKYNEATDSLTNMSRRAPQEWSDGDVDVPVKSMPDHTDPCGYDAINQMWTRKPKHTQKEEQP